MRLVQQMLNNSSLQKMLFHNFRDIRRGNPVIVCTLGIYNNDGASLAKTKASGPDNLDFFFQPFVFQFLFKFFNDLVGSG